MNSVRNHVSIAVSQPTALKPQFFLFTFMKEIPHKVADLIAQYVPPKEYIKLLLVCKEWSNAFAAVMYNSPPLNHPDAFEQLMSTFKGFHPYNKYIQRLNISGAAADNIYMGDLELCLKECTNLKAFKLERCYHISNMVIESIAKHCQNLEEVSHEILIL